MPVYKYMDMKQTGYINNIDNGFFGCVLFVCIIMSVFCSLFIGTEYSDGTIRNKIIIGQKRDGIYLSNLITCSVVGLLMCVVFFVPFLIIGIPLLGHFSADTKIILLFVLQTFILAVVFSSVFTLIAMHCHNKAIAVVICILLAFTLLFSGFILNAMLDATETVGGYTMDANGELVYNESPNPKYLDGMKRKIVQTVYDINPGGQAIQCVFMSAVNMERLPIYSLIIIILSAVAGVFFFRKKDLK